MLSRLRRDQRGFTLVELLIAIVILGIIIVPLANGLIAFFRNSDATTGRLSESHDAQLAAAYFAQDVQSVGVRDWTASPYALKQSVEQNVGATGGLYPCGTGTTAVLRLAWDDPTSASGAPATVRVAYVIATSAGGEQQLRRIACGTGTTTPTSDVVLVHNLVSATVVCSSQCTAASVPKQITLQLVIKNSATSASLNVDLIGQRRQS